jgi:alcohol dehydrogenase
MQLGAAYAGIAIENSMLGAAHSAANPLTAHFSTIHGQAVGTMLPHVVRFNAAEPAPAETYRELALAAGLVESAKSTAQAVEALAARLERLLSLAGAPATLVEAGADPGLIPVLAAEAAGQWTARYNPREIDAPQFEVLYAAACGV